MAEKLTQQALAVALGISQGMVSRLVRDGMPTASVAEAEAWRRQNLDPSFTKDNRMPGPDPVAEVDRLGRLAMKDFDVYGERVRKAFLALPAAQQDLVRLDFALWDRLCGCESSTLESTPNLKGH
jgi:hypothetical protein